MADSIVITGSSSACTSSPGPWVPAARRVDFQQGLSEMIELYRESEAWVRRIENGEYRE